MALTGAYQTHSAPTGELLPSDSTAEMEGEWQFTKDGGEKSAVGKTPAEVNLLSGCNTGLLCVSHRR